MSAPLILPKGNDRTWTRGFYRAINKVMRRIWYEEKCDEKVHYAWMGMITEGVGYFRVALHDEK